MYGAPGWVCETGNQRCSKLNGPPTRNSTRRFTSCEERKDRLATPWSGAFRWFASSNVAKLEDYRPAGEMAGIIVRLRERRRDDVAAAIAKVLSKANRKQG